MVGAELHLAVHCSEIDGSGDDDGDDVIGGGAKGCEERSLAAQAGGQQGDGDEIADGGGVDERQSRA